MSKFRVLGWMMVFGLLATAVACGGSSPANQEMVSAFTQAEATELAENAMQGFASGDYATWSRDWSQTMKNGINEAAFLAYRQEVSKVMGAYQSIESVTMAPSTTAGYIRWVVVANFENGQMEFAFSFRQDGKLVEGVFPRQLG